MIHPPTECTDQKALAKVITAEDINKSVAWYEQNWSDIASALPLVTKRTTYTQRWQEIFDYSTLPMWRAGTLSITLASAYIYVTLRHVYLALKRHEWRNRDGPVSAV